MLNDFPKWKSIIVLLTIMLCSVYALPNLFPEQPAVQVGVNKAGEVITTEDAEKVDQILADNSITPRKILWRKGSYILLFADNDEQKKAQSLLRRGLGENYSAALNLISDSPAWLRAIHANPMKLGLDLRGGVHFLLEVDIDKKLASQDVETFKGIRKIFRKATSRDEIISSERLRTGVYKFSFSDKDARTKARKALQKDGQGRDYVMTNMSIDGNPGFALALTDAAKDKQVSDAVNQNRVALTNRIGALGVAEPLVQRQGYNRIVVELPGVQDTAIAKRVIGRTADLEFRAVKERFPRNTKRAPAGTELILEKGTERPILLAKRSIVDGKCVTGASAGFDSQSGSPQVSVKLSSKCGGRMMRFTSANIKKLMSVVFIETKATSKMVMQDGKEVEIFETHEERRVINTATIEGAFGNQFQITGLDSLPEANELALLLKAGALAAPMYIVEESTIGPTLGAKNIKQGFFSLLIGFLLVLVLMVLKYRAYGMIANMALAANVIIIIGLLSLFSGTPLATTLTLPGIAGIVLTVGMAVDANVLIFSRIKEEVLKGRTPAEAIEEGYDKAFSAIIDANVTTLIIAVILLAMGTGSVKGFASTLAIGIMTSMFTAIWGTRAIIQLMYGKKKITKLSIG